MQVDGPRAQLTAAGIGYLRPAAAAENGTQKDHRRAHPAHQRVGNIAARQRRSVYQQVTALPPDLAAQMPQDLRRGLHIAQPRAVPDPAGVLAQDRSRQNRQHTVFGTLYFYFAGQGPASLQG